MTDWKTITGSQTEQPAEIDKTSSPTTVYLRKNIEQVEKEDTNGEKVTLWQYDEREMTTAEYENMLLMQQVVSEHATSIVDSVTSFQKEAAIDEYTAQLIADGIL